MRFRRPSHATVIAYLALFIALGGTAMAAVIITSNSQVATDTISGHKPPTGDHSNIIGGSVNATDLSTRAVTSGKLASGAVTNSKLAGGAVAYGNIASDAVAGSKVLDNTLTGADIADRSGVDTCPSPLTAKFGPICEGSDGVARTWLHAIQYCAGLGLRLPSFSEALTLALNYDVPGVQEFWTDEEVTLSNGYGAEVVDDDTGGTAPIPVNDDWPMICVTDPSA